MKATDLLRYGLWAAVAATSAANEREYHMTTTWLPHFLANSLTLLFPEVVRAALGNRQRGDNLAEDVLIRMVRDNNDYAYYVTPLAVGYILSHPRFNIYKGGWADIRLAGFGLDAIPHAATGFALTALVTDTLNETQHLRLPHDALGDTVRETRKSPAVSSLGILALLTFIWELSEYRVHVHELALRGDVSKINMQWSGQDTANDIVANIVGWVLASLWRRKDPTINRRKRALFR